MKVSPAVYVLMIITAMWFVWPAAKIVQASKGSPKEIRSISSIEQ
jgi:hypothetical protein